MVLSWGFSKGDGKRDWSGRNAYHLIREQEWYSMLPFGSWRDFARWSVPMGGSLIVVYLIIHSYGFNPGVTVGAIVGGVIGESGSWLRTARRMGTVLPEDREAFFDILHESKYERTGVTEGRDVYCRKLAVKRFRIPQMDASRILVNEHANGSVGVIFRGCRLGLLAGLTKMNLI